MTRRIDDYDMQRYAVCADEVSDAFPFRLHSEVQDGPFSLVVIRSFLQLCRCNKISNTKKKHWRKKQRTQQRPRCFSPNSFHSGDLLACLRWELPKLLAKYKNPRCNKSTEGPFFLPSNIPSSPGGGGDGQTSKHKD